MSDTSDGRAEWVCGDIFGLAIPAHGAALRAAGESFLTRAFQASGVLAADNRVTHIAQFEEWLGGSTGRKVLMSVTYERAAPGLYTELFVKFSRDFADVNRDHAKHQMESEVRFAVLSRVPGFPIAVPACLFADYHRPSGTGILITQRITFGTAPIEPHYDKCLDYRLPHPLEHYRALVKALARLAGSHKGGLLPSDIAEQFPFEPDKLAVSERAPYTPDQVKKRLLRYADFAARFPRLLPSGIGDAAFIARLAIEAVRFPQYERAIKDFLNSDPDLVALCHWNANIDNAWFWRDAGGELQCGLMDWGHASQMSVAMALWGALSAAEIELWENHLDELLTLFVAEFRRCGGPAIAVDELRLHLYLYIALMGLSWLLDVPAYLQARIPELAAVENRFDPRIHADEAARVRLQMMIVFLHLWRSQDFGQALDRFLERAPGPNEPTHRRSSQLP